MKVENANVGVVSCPYCGCDKVTPVRFEESSGLYYYCHHCHRVFAFLVVQDYLLASLTVFAVRIFF